MMFNSATVLVGMAAVAAAQAPLYGQCGGNNWTGATTCVSGSQCTVLNEWYHQCVPGQAAPPTTTRPGPTTTPKPVTTTTTARQTSTSAAPPPTQSGTKYLITFGDSYSQTGFDINGQKPSAANPLGNPALPGWTASGGLDWVGFMVTEFNTSLTLSYNFAYGGATVDAALVPPYASTVLSLIDQVKQFSGSIASKPSYAPWTADNTVAGIWMGVNDVGNSFWLEGRTELYGKIVNRYFEQVQVLYNAGIRKFVILTVPPTDKSPLMLANGEDSLKQLRAAIADFNQQIAGGLSKFTASNAGVTAKVVDTSLGFNTALNSPKDYGSPDATCYNGDGKSCLWFNDYHPAVAIQRLVGSQVAKAWSGFFKCVNSVLC